MISMLLTGYDVNKNVNDYSWATIQFKWRNKYYRIPPHCDFGIVCWQGNKRNEVDEVYEVGV